MSCKNDNCSCNQQAKYTIVKQYNTPVKGESGLTPYIGINYNWFIGGVDTGFKAVPDDGISPTIGENGDWFIGDVDTGVQAQGEGVPNGGTTSQVLVKVSETNFDTEWTSDLQVNSVSSQSITVLDTPVELDDATNKDYVDTVSFHVNKAQLDTIDQDLASTDTPTFANVNTDAPFELTHATNKDYVDDLYNSIVNDFQARIEKLERVAAPFTVTGNGGMVLWNRPANEIPSGWQEVVNWRGRLPIGYNPADVDFDTVGEQGGNKNYTLTLSNVPPHNHTVNLQPLNSNSANGSGKVATGNDPAEGTIPIFNTGTAGGSGGVAQSFSILNPYRVVVFIEYIGG
jgi:hypothetical protein